MTSPEYLTNCVGWNKVRQSGVALSQKHTREGSEVMLDRELLGMNVEMFLNRCRHDLHNSLLECTYTLYVSSLHSCIVFKYQP